MMLTLIATRARAEGQLPDLPNKHGVAGVFAGVSQDAFLVAGGANFPDRMPWEGGTKVWHDAVYVLPSKTGKWQVAGRLPRVAAYGVSASFGERVILVGGADDKKHFAESILLEWKSNELNRKQLPELPQPLAYACGSVLGTKLYIFGGQASPDGLPQKTLYRLDLSVAEPHWDTLDECPGPGRMLAVAAVADHSIWIIGGVDLVKDNQGQFKRQYLNTVYRYQERRGWQQMTSLPKAIAAAPSPAPNTEHGFAIIGGDDGTQAGRDPAVHRGFCQEILEYDVAKNRWQTTGKLATPRVTTPCVLWHDGYFVPSGEIGPGRRTPTILSLELPEATTDPR